MAIIGWTRQESRLVEYGRVLNEIERMESLPPSKQLTEYGTESPRLLREKRDTLKAEIIAGMKNES